MINFKKFTEATFKHSGYLVKDRDFKSNQKIAKFSTTIKLPSSAGGGEAHLYWDGDTIMYHTSGQYQNDGDVHIVPLELIPGISRINNVKDLEKAGREMAKDM